jgi:hypothetical protein
MRLCYDDDPDWPVELGDEVVVIAADYRFPAIVKKVMPKVVSFENIDPVLDLIMLRKSARVPISAVELVQRGW